MPYGVCTSPTTSNDDLSHFIPAIRNKGTTKDKEGKQLM